MGKVKERGEEEGALIMVGSVLRGGPVHIKYNNALYLRIRKMMVSGWGMTEGMIMRTT